MNSLFSENRLAMIEAPSQAEIATPLAIAGTPIPNDRRTETRALVQRIMPDILGELIEGVNPKLEIAEISNFTRIWCKGDTLVFDCQTRHPDDGNDTIRGDQLVAVSCIGNSNPRIFNLPGYSNTGFVIEGKHGKLFGKKLGDEDKKVYSLSNTDRPEPLIINNQNVIELNQFGPSDELPSFAGVEGVEIMQACFEDKSTVLYYANDPNRTPIKTANGEVIKYAEVRKVDGISLLYLKTDQTPDGALFTNSASLAPIYISTADDTKFRATVLIAKPSSQYMIGNRSVLELHTDESDCYSQILVYADSINQETGQATAVTVSDKDGNVFIVRHDMARPGVYYEEGATAVQIARPDLSHPVLDVIIDTAAMTIIEEAN